MGKQKKTNKELENESERINNVSGSKFTPFALKMLSKKSHILILAAIVIVVLVTGGYFYYSYSAGQLRADKENDLKAIAELKTEQLVGWHKERIVDAKVISESTFFVKGIEEWLGHKNMRPLSADILEILNSANTNFGYENIFLVSTKGELLLSVDSTLESVDAATTEKIIEASGSGKITFTDFYFCQLHNKIHYDIIAPIKNNNNRIIADLIFRVDPYDFLYPLIQSWPTPSKSAEVLLFKIDGDSVLYLNELKHQKNTAVQLRIPLTRTGLPATQAILGKTGIFDGKDYRDVEVVTYLSAVPETDWFMVSKVDKDEIFAGLNFIASIVFIVIVLLILALSIGMVWIYHYRQMNVFRNLWQVEEESRATLYSIGDGVISTDIDGLIAKMNPIAEKLCGWELKDALGKPLTEVFKIINSDTRETVINPVQLVLENGEIVGLANHTILISKNGNEYQISDSAAPIKNKDGEISGVVLVFSDVTQKYAAEKAIRDSEKFLKETQIIAQLGTYTLNINTGNWSSSEILDQIFGIEKNHDKSVDGWLSIIHPDWNKTMNDYFIGEVIGKKIKFEKEYQIIRKSDNEVRWVHGIGKLEFDEQGNPVRMLGTIRDITERKLAEEAIKSIAKVYSSATGILLFENICRHISTNLNVSYAFIGELMPDEKIKVIAGIGNGEILNTFYYDLEATPCENVIGQSVCIYPTNVQRLFPKDQLLVEMNIDSYVGIPLFDSFGKTIGIMVLLDCKPIDNPEVYTSFLQIFSERVAIEMTRLKTEEELQKSNEKLLNFFEDDISADFLSTPDGEIIFCNKTFVELFGFVSKEEAMSYNAKNLYKNSTERDKYLALLLANKRVKNYECAYVTKNGINIYGLINAVGEFDEAGELIQIKGYIIDITVRKIAEEELLKLGRAVSQSPASVVITNLQGDIEYVNQKFCSLTGYSEEEVIGKNPRILNSGYSDNTFYKELWNTLLSGNEWQGEFHNKKKNGELFWETSLISPLVNQNGDITHFIAIKEDITEKKKMLVELIKAKEKAEESDRLKSAFLANMSHEIRTPMNSILGFSELLMNQDLTSTKQEKYHEIVNSSGKRLMNLINDIVDVSKLDAHELSLNSAVFNLNKLLDQLQQQFSISPKNKNTAISTVKELKNEDSFINADETRLAQVISNLLENALKFTHDGTVELGYTLDENQLHFYVKDSGVGINAKDHQHIFERFGQSDNEILKVKEGSGLGLAISKGIVELFRGNIWVESEPNKGATFHFTIPNCVVAHEEKSSNGKPIENTFISTNKTILVAEDEETNYWYIEAALDGHPFDLIHVLNGKEAVEVMQTNNNIDLILMDINMPVMNGKDATIVIRKTHPAIPIIALTAYAMETDRGKALAFGCADYLSKPVLRDLLLETIHKHVHSSNLK